MSLYVFSGAARPSAPDPASVRRPDRLHERRPVDGPYVPVQFHLYAVTGWALPHVPLWSVHAAQQHHGHREHLWAGRPPPLQRRRVGQKHPLLSGTADHRSGGPSKTQLERVVCVERRPVLNAPTRGSPFGGGGAPRLPYGRRQGGGLHGPYQNFSRTSGKVKNSSRRLRWI